MKIAMINFSGNVGKSTLAKHMFLPRMKDTALIPVESLNKNRFKNVSNLRGKEFGEIMEFVNTQDSALVDVGSSNAEEFTRLMKQYRNSHQGFDYYFVPAAPGDKEEEDTISTIEALAAIGVPAAKVRMMFNKVAAGDKVENVFPGLIAYQKSEKKFTVHPDAVVYNTELFLKLKAMDKEDAWVPDLAADTTDYRAKIKDAKDPAEKLHLVRMISVQGLSQSIHDNYEAVFKSLFKK